MAAISSNGTGGGSSSAGASWAGGVVPVEGDKVTIVLGDTITVDSTHIWGDDSSSAVTVNGTLKASRAASSSLTVKGALLTATATTATIDYGRRSTTDRIPSGVTADIILNYSASLATFKWGMTVNAQANFYLGGKVRTRNARLTSAIVAGATSADVDDVTGWEVGDEVVFSTSDGTDTHYDTGTIASITPGSGTAGAITFGAVSYDHDANCPIGNMTSNVTISAYNGSSNGTFISIRSNSNNSDNRREIDDAVFNAVGSLSSSTLQMFVIVTSTNTPSTPFVSFSSNFFRDCGRGSALMINNLNQGADDLFVDCGFFSELTAGGSPHVWFAAGTFIKLNRFVFYHAVGGNASVSSSYSQGGQGCEIIDSTFCGRQTVSHTNGDGLIYRRCGFHTPASGSPYIGLSSGKVEFIDCNFGNVGAVSGDAPVLWGTPTADYIVNMATPGSYGQHVMADCWFATPAIIFASNVANANPLWKLIVANKNIDPSVQEIYTPTGTIQRDNTSKISGVTSLKMSPTSSSAALTFTMDIPAPNGNLVGISGKLWRDTANIATVTLSGLGITSSVYTASGSLSANETFSVQGTNNSGTDGLLTLTIAVTGTSGNMWVDAISAPQAAAIDFGEFGFWARGLPASLVTASFVSAGDVWNYLLANITTSGSIGKKLKNLQSFLKID